MTDPEQKQLNDCCGKLRFLYEEDQKRFKRLIYGFIMKARVRGVEDFVDLDIEDAVENLACAIEMYIEEHPEPRNGEVAYDYNPDLNVDPFKGLRSWETKHYTKDTHFLPKILAGRVNRLQS